MTDRGQAHTLEAVAASIIMVASVVFALQITAVTPLTASTASQHIENQQAGVGEGILDAAEANGTLKPTVLFWNTSGTFHDVGDEGTYPSGGPPTDFGAELNTTFLDRGIAFDVSIRYVDVGGDVKVKEMVNLGVPSDHAVTVRRTVTLYDDDPIYHENGTASSKTVSDVPSYFAPDAAPDSPVFNVVQVEVTIWRM